MNLHKLALSGLLVGLKTSSSAANSMENLDAALLSDLLQQYTNHQPSTCTGAEGTTTFSFNYPGVNPDSDWYPPFIPFEADLFLAEMSHTDAGKNSWTIRVGQGGNMYSHFNPGRYGETMPPQEHPLAPFIDEVHQSVAVNTNLNLHATNCNGGQCPANFAHGAGTYQKDSPYTDVPFFSPSIAKHCEGATCTFAALAQQAHLKTIFTSPVMTLNRFTNCGNGIIEHTEVIHNFAPEGSSSLVADLGYFNAPWSGVRRSNLPFVLEPNPVTGQLSFDDPDTVDYCPLCPWGNDEAGGPQDIGNGQCARDSLNNLKGFTTFTAPGLYLNRATTQMVVADGCLSSGTSYSDQCFQADSQHAVNCCSGSLSEGTLQCSRPGCVTGQKMNFMDAEAHCESNSMRLCSVAELNSNACCSQGCNFDSDQGWTSDTCTKKYLWCRKPGADCYANPGGCMADANECYDLVDGSVKPGYTPLTLRILAGKTPNCQGHVGLSEGFMTVACRMRPTGLGQTTPYLYANDSADECAPWSQDGQMRIVKEGTDDGISIPYVRHWSWSPNNEMMYFSVYSQDQAEAINMVNQAFDNSQGSTTMNLEFKVIPPPGSSAPGPDYNPAALDSFTYVNGFGLEYGSTVPGASRRRMGAANRDYTVYTINYWQAGAKLAPGNTFSKRAFFFASDLGDAKTTADSLIPKVVPDKIAVERWNPRAVDIYATGSSFDVVAASAQGTSTSCTSTSAALACSGYSTPKAGHVAFFYVTCGTSKYLGQDPYHFTPGNGQIFTFPGMSNSNTEYIRSYACVGEAASVRPIWKLIGFFNPATCTSFGAGFTYDDNICTEPTLTSAPTNAPTTLAPTDVPMTPAPTNAPTTLAPTNAPMTSAPTNAPTTSAPTNAPTTLAPTDAPMTPAPTNAPTTSAPTNAPMTSVPTNAPTTLAPTNAPMTAAPTNAPTTLAPTNAPMTSAPTDAPMTSAPTNAPTTQAPTRNPTSVPTNAPTAASTPAATIDKYICTKNQPLDSSICADGQLAGGSCSTVDQPDGCGNGGKVCWWASCPSGAPVTPAPTNADTPPPGPTPPPVTVTPAPTSSNPPPATIDKYICTKNEPLDSTICADGQLAGGSCSIASQPDGCGNGGKVCWWASCPSGAPVTPAPTNADTPPPGPTTPSPTPPPVIVTPAPTSGSCPVCVSTGETCCAPGTCVDSGKPSNRGCK